MPGAVMLKGLARIASRWDVLSCDTDWQWCDAGCRYLSNNPLATLPENFGNLKVGGELKVLPLCVCLCMHGAVMLKGCARIASMWGGLACDADGRWCDDGCRYLSNNQLAALPESFGDLKVGGSL